MNKKRPFASVVYARAFLEFIEKEGRGVRTANDWAEHRPDLYVGWKAAVRIGVAPKTPNPILRLWQKSALHGMNYGGTVTGRSSGGRRR